MTDFIRGSVIRKEYDISSGTLRRWADTGKVRALVSEVSGHRRYSLSDVRKALGDVEHKDEKEAPPRSRIVYARVSSEHQRADLVRQIDDLQREFPEHEVVSDVGSGLNFKRRGFAALLERVHGGSVEEVVVAHRDRLCRFAADLVEFIFKKAGTRLVVRDVCRDGEDGRGELADDLLSVATVFVARHNGRRSADHRRARKRARKEVQTQKDGRKE